MSTIRQDTAQAVCNLIGSAGVLLEDASAALQPLSQPSYFAILDGEEGMALVVARQAIHAAMDALVTVQVRIEGREGVQAARAETGE